MNETDRELLGWAVKAAGMQIDHGVKIASGHLLVMCEGTPSFWNPLTDDGDAFRLAVKLRLLWYIESPFEEVQINQEHNALCQATRRAIVRAAAEIGRNMK